MPGLKMHAKPSCSFDDVPGGLPSVNIPTDVDLSEVQKAAQHALDSFGAASLTGDALWRDWLSITGRVQTRGGSETIAELWRLASASRTPYGFATQPGMVVRIEENTSWVNIPFTFSTKQSDGLVGMCSGVASLIPENGDAQSSWKIWSLATMLVHFKDKNSPDTLEPQPHQRTTPNSSGVYEVSALVVGAGQSGLSVAGRLAALGLDYVLLEKQPAVGYGWSGKYDSVKQHTIREFNNLPFDRTWKASDPMLLPAATVVEGFQNYVEKYHINIWLSSTIESCQWEAKTSSWTVKVLSEGDTRTIQTKHLLLSIGAGNSVASRPDWPNEKEFQGKVLHAVDYKNSKAWKGQRGVVIGTGATAHDAAEDMLEAGLSKVTIVQRSKTSVLPVQWVLDNQSIFYNTDIPTMISDAMGASAPLKVTRDIFNRSHQKYMKDHSEHFDSLERAGFLLDREYGLLDGLISRWGGYYVDVGAAAKIASGKIRIKAGIPVTNFTPRGLAFADGTELEADVIVQATGWERDYRKQVAPIVGDDIASRLGEFWGIDEHGDIRGLMRQEHPGLWLMGGGADQARFFSRFVALQIQADRLTHGSTAEPVSI